MAEGELNKFQSQMLFIMCWIIHWKRKLYKPCLNYIQMKDLFIIENDGLKFKENIKNDRDVLE